MAEKEHSYWGGTGGDFGYSVEPPARPRPIPDPDIAKMDRLDLMIQNKALSRRKRLEAQDELNIMAHYMLDGLDLAYSDMESTDDESSSEVSSSVLSTTFADMMKESGFQWIKSKKAWCWGTPKTGDYELVLFEGDVRPNESKILQEIGKTAWDCMRNRKFRDVKFQISWFRKHKDSFEKTQQQAEDATSKFACSLFDSEEPIAPLQATATTGANARKYLISQSAIAHWRAIPATSDSPLTKEEFLKMIQKM